MRVRKGFKIPTIIIPTCRVLIGSWYNCDPKNYGKPICQVDQILSVFMPSLSQHHCYVSHSGSFLWYQDGHDICQTFYTSRLLTKKILPESVLFDIFDISQQKCVNLALGLPWLLDNDCFVIVLDSKPSSLPDQIEISLHISAFLCISLHFSEFTCILHF